MNYARRQEYGRLSRAGRAGAGSIVAALLALVVAGAGVAPLAGLLLVIAFGRGSTGVPGRRTRGGMHPASPTGSASRERWPVQSRDGR